jgi:hypothetical protein
MMKEEFNKLNTFQQQMMNTSKISMLDKSNSSLINSHSDPDSPTRLTNNQLNDVKAKLNKVKMTKPEPNSVYL